MHSIAVWRELDEDTVHKIKCAILKTVGFRDRAHLVEGMRDFVHYSNLQGIPVKLASMTRRFAKEIKRLAPGETCQSLMHEYDAIPSRVGNASVILSKTFKYQYIEALKELYVDEHELEVAFTAFLMKAQ